MSVAETLSEAERSDLLATIRRLARERIAPIALELANTHEWPEQLFELLRGQGYFGLYYPSQYGGIGLSLRAFSEIIEELAAVSNTAASMVLGQHQAGPVDHGRGHGSAARPLAARRWRPGRSRVRWR